MRIPVISIGETMESSAGSRFDRAAKFRKPCSRPTSFFLPHAGDELRHADLLSGRIIQLGGTPVTTPKKWFEWSNCSYEDPADPFVRKILEQNIAGEQCAISVYHALLEEVNGKDPVTYNLATQILQDEVEHEEDLQALQEDLNIMLRDRG